MQKYSKDNMDATMKMWGQISKGFQAIAAETADYSKKSFEEGTAALEKLLGVKSLEKAIEIQTTYAKSTYDGFVAQATKMSELYAAIRVEPDPALAWKRWRDVRDRLFRSHPQSPVPEADRGDATVPAYFDYDPALRTVADIEGADGATFELPGSTSGHVTAERAGTAHCTLRGERIAEEFQAIVLDYVRRRYGRG